MHRGNECGLLPNYLLLFLLLLLKQLLAAENNIGQRDRFRCIRLRCLGRHIQRCAVEVDYQKVISNTRSSPHFLVDFATTPTEP